MKACLISGLVAGGQSPPLYGRLNRPDRAGRDEAYGTPGETGMPNRILRKVGYVLPVFRPNATLFKLFRRVYDSLCIHRSLCNQRRPLGREIF